MRGYEAVPNELTLDEELPLGAKAIYPALLHLVWERDKGGEHDFVRFPPLAEIASIVGCSHTALKGYVIALRKAGWVTTRRVAGGMAWAIHDTPVKGGIRTEQRAESALASSIGTLDTKSPKNGLLSEDDPPKLTVVDGRNLGFDAIAAECGIAANSPRGGEIGVALNGVKKNLEEFPGIRRQFWREQGVESSRIGPLHDYYRDAEDGPEDFERDLADAIRARADLYRRRMPPKTMLTPTALAKYWTDLPRMGDGGGMAALNVAQDELRRMEAER